MPARRIVLIIACLGIASACLMPPWEGVFDQGGVRIVQLMGYAPLWYSDASLLAGWINPYVYSGGTDDNQTDRAYARISLPRLSVELIAIVALAGVLYLLTTPRTS